MWNNVDKNNRNMINTSSLNKNKLFNSIIFIVVVLLTPCICKSSKISDKRLCYDIKCSEIISEGKTITLYHSNDPDILSFKVNEDVKIYSKSAGKRDDLWGAIIQGKRGYVPKRFILEKRIYQKDLKFEVPTELNNPDPEPVKSSENSDSQSTVDSTEPSSKVVSKEESNDSSVPLTPSIDTVSPSFEVVDGTTLPVLEESQQQEESYATKLLPGTEPTKEQPALTIHPDVMSSELNVAEDSSSGTSTLPTAANLEAVEASKDASESVENVPESPGEEAKSDDNVNPSESSNEIESEAAESGSKLAEDILVNAFETFTSLFESMTTETPEDKVESNTPEVIPETTAAPEVQTVPVLEDSTVQSSVKESANVNNDNQNLINDSDKEKKIGQPEIIAQDDSSGSRQSPVENPVDFNEFLNDGNSLNVQNENSSILNNNVEVESFSTIAADFTETKAEINNEVPKVESSTTIAANPAEVSHETVNANFSETKAELNTEVPKVESNTTTVANPVEVSNETNANVAEKEAEMNNEVSNVESNTTIASNPAEVSNESNANVAETEAETSTLINPSDLEQTINSTESNFESLVDPVEIESESFDTSNRLNINEDVCHADNTCDSYKTAEVLPKDDEDVISDKNSSIQSFEFSQNYWETLSYLGLTAFTTLLFSLGYYYIENSRRDGQLIAKINKLEKDLLVSNKECCVLDETLKTTKVKLNSIEDESFGSNEMVAALKQDLDTANNTKLDLENQVAVLEKDLESATEAGLELERMLREILASNSAENSLTKSIEDLQSRLNAQQSANEALTNVLQLKTQENESLSKELAQANRKYEELEVEIARINEELNLMTEKKNSVEQNSVTQIEQLEKQLKNSNAEKTSLRKQLKGKEMELNDLLEAIKQSNTNNFNVDKLLDASQVKAEATLLKEERDKLLSRLSDIEGAHQLLEEHMKVINEELSTLNEQCKLAEKEKKDAETKLEVLTKFFKEKEAEHQKEEAVWMQQQGEVSTTSERLQTMRNEIQSYKQQIETLKREILDQEREYKSQISALEAKAHEQWVLARQNERRLEESKAEAGQLRNRLTMVEKNMSDNDSDVKGHRLEANGETASSPQLFLGAESSSSPIMFSSSSNIPPPPPPFLYAPPLLPPSFIPPPLPGSSNMQPGYDVGQRLPPLGEGRLSSPPPISQPSPSSLRTGTSGRFDRSAHSPSPPISSHFDPFRSPPPPPIPHIPFPNDRIPPPPLPPHLTNPHPNWDDKHSSSRKNGIYHHYHRDQPGRDYKVSSASSEESLDKSRRRSKV